MVARQRRTTVKKKTATKTPSSGHWGQLAQKVVLNPGISCAEKVHRLRVAAITVLAYTCNGQVLINLCLEDNLENERDL